MNTEAWIIGLQLAAAHFGSGSSSMEWATPGIYVRHPSGFTAGFYRNSLGRGSAFAAWTWQTESRTWAITVGAVTGYDRSKVMPLVVPSVRFPIPDTSIALRISAVPPIAKHNIIGALTVALEREF